jgi:uncharacterized protein YdeI (YjbR/CyaY-like superfamily)
MNITETLYVADRNKWRAWLEKHHDKKKEIWLIYYKKHTNQPSIPYDDAVEEALCFGWIDSTVKRIDEERTAQRFTPRKDTSNWSNPNRRRIRKLVAEGKMTEAGFAKFSAEILDERNDPKPQPRNREIAMPEYFEQALMKNKRAWENFNNLAPSYRNDYIVWVARAKREETRLKRLKEAVTLLKQNKKLGMK